MGGGSMRFGKRVKKPALVASVTVMLSDTAIAVSGMPQLPATVILCAVPALSGPGPGCGSYGRVSRTRQGGTVKKEVPTLGPVTEIDRKSTRLNSSHT